MPPTTVSAPDLTAITVFLASTATPERSGLPYLDAVLPAEDRLAATRVARDLGALPPDAILLSPRPTPPRPCQRSTHAGPGPHDALRGALRGRGQRRVDRCHGRV